MKEKIGLAVTTYNCEKWYKELFDTIPFHKIDVCVTVNGGNKYKNEYNCNWIQHNSNNFAQISRNDGITFLLNHGCHHIFIIEDDMLIKDENIFDRYIEAHKQSKLRYFSYVGPSDGAGRYKNRTPKITIDYSNNVKIDFYQNMSNELSYHYYKNFEEIGLYDSVLDVFFDCEYAYRVSQTKWGNPFWWFPDINNSDDYIMPNPETVSRIKQNNTLNNKLPKAFEHFKNKHGYFIQQVPQASRDDLIKKLKNVSKNTIL